MRDDFCAMCGDSELPIFPLVALATLAFIGLAMLGWNLLT